MITARLGELEPEEVWSEDDASIRSRDAYPLFWGTGTGGSSMVYFELEQGRRLGAHTHSAEEVVFVVAGTVEVSVGEERERLSAGGIAVAPALAPHDVLGASGETARCIGFFPAGAVVTVFEQPLSPGASRIQGTPAPEGVLGLES